MARKTACLPKGTRISDYVTLGVLTTTVPGDLIDAVLSDTGKQSRRYRQLPARLVVYYVMALVLFAQASYGAVLRCLLEGAASEGREHGAGRQVGDHQGAHPARHRAAEGTVRAGGATAGRARARGIAAGAWSAAPPSWCPTNRSWFGRPYSSPGAFPQARLLALMESGTHAIFA